MSKRLFYIPIIILSVVIFIIIIFKIVIPIIRWYIPFFQSRNTFVVEHQNGKTNFRNDYFNITFEVPGKCNIDSDLINHLIAKKGFFWTARVRCYKKIESKNFGSLYLVIRPYEVNRLDMFRDAKEKLVINNQFVIGGRTDNVFRVAISRGEKMLEIRGAGESLAASLLSSFKVVNEF